MRRALGPALWAMILALPVLTEGRPTALSASFFAFAMHAEAATLAIAAGELSSSVWAILQSATLDATPFPLTVLAQGATIAVWAYFALPTVLADLTTTAVRAV